MEITALEIKEAILYSGFRFEDIETNEVECDNEIIVNNSIIYDTIDKKYYSVYWKEKINGEQIFYKQIAKEVKKIEITRTEWIPVNYDL